MVAGGKNMVQLNLSSLAPNEKGSNEKSEYLRSLEAASTYEKPKAWEYVASTVKIRDRLEDHEVIFGNDKMLPRAGGTNANSKNIQQRYFAARRNALLLGAMGEEQLEAAKAVRRRKSKLLRISKGVKVLHEDIEIPETPVARVWSNGRLGRAFQDFGQTNDWVSRVLLRNAVASVIQAIWRGVLLRRRWRQSPQRVVDDLKEAEARAAAAAIEAEERRSMRLALVARTKGHSAAAVMDGKQMVLAAGVLSKVFGTKGGKGTGGKWGTAKLKAVADVRSHSTEPDGSLSNSDSDVSDFELEAIETLKMRARTPPWAHNESGGGGGKALLSSRPMRGNVDVLWDPTECQWRLDQARDRRAQRCPATTGEDPDPASVPLPPDLVNDMLLDRYIEKYQRLGLLDSNKMGQWLRRSQQATRPED